MLSNTYGSAERRRRRRLRGIRCGSCYRFTPGPTPPAACSRCGRSFDSDAPALLCWETRHPSGTVADEWTAVGIWGAARRLKPLARRAGSGGRPPVGSAGEALPGADRTHALATRAGRA